MTIEELLAMAQRSLELSEPPHEEVSPAEVAISTMYAAIAQAAAMTAQAIIMHDQTQEIAAANERAELQELWRQ